MKIFAIGIALLFGIVAGCTSSGQHVVAGEGERIYFPNQVLNADSNSKLPDIYWFHLDGMLSFDTVYTLFGDKQEELINELHRRGFVINYDASLNAGSTQWAYLVLKSPGFYDELFGAILEEYAFYTRYPRCVRVQDALNRKGVDLENDVVPYPELFVSAKS